MQIKIGEYYVNKTWKYLLPCLKDYGPVFAAKVSTLYKLAAGIDDGLFHTAKNQRLIYLLIDRRFNSKVSSNIMTWLSYQPYVIANYPYDNGEGARKHMYVVKIPPRYHHAYDRFIKGKYSEMYTKAQISLLYKEDPDNKVIGVFNKTLEAKVEFVDKINNSFNTDMTVGDLDPTAELDFPLEQEKEMFNHEFITSIST